MAKGKGESAGETPRFTFRFPDEAVTKLDGLVEAFAAESGRPENRTTVILQLIHREAARREKTATKK
jgi:hypothetical protein